MSEIFNFFKQKTAYEMRYSDWSSDLCASDLQIGERGGISSRSREILLLAGDRVHQERLRRATATFDDRVLIACERNRRQDRNNCHGDNELYQRRWEEHTSELLSLMRTSYVVFCSKKKTNKHTLYKYIHPTQPKNTTYTNTTTMR